MKFGQSLLLAAATINLAIGAPIKQEKSRAVVAKDAAKRAVANNPYYVRTASAEPKPAEDAETLSKLRSLIALLKRTSLSDLNKRYEYKDTPRPSTEALHKRYEYKDTPRPSTENLHKRYEYKDTPAVSKASLVAETK